MSTDNRLLQRRKPFLFGLVVFSAFLLLVEIALRVFGYQAAVDGNITLIDRNIVKDPFPNVPYLYEPNASYTQTWPDNPRNYFDDPGNSITYRINNAGFRGEEFKKESERIRIVFIGDSFCWGNGVRREDHFQSRLSEQLGPEVETMNFGLGSFSTKQEVALYEQIASEYEHQIAVVWFFLNDFNNELGTMSYLGGNDLGRRLRRLSRIADLMIAPIEARVKYAQLIEDYQNAYSDGSEGWSDIKKSLQRFHKLCRDNKVTPALAVHPILADLGDGYPFANIHGKVVAYAEQLGIAAVDLRPAFEGENGPELWVHKLDQHPNEEAHKLAADFYYPSLKELVDVVSSTRRD